MYTYNVQIYRVGAHAWADGPIRGLHLRDHLRGTYGALTGSSRNFPSQGSWLKQTPGGAQRDLQAFRQGWGMVDEFPTIFA